MRRYVLYGKSGASPSTDFIIKVKTDNAGTSADNQFTYTGGVGGYDVLAINQSTFVEQTFTGLSGAATLTFSEGAGTYILKLTPTGGTPFNRLAFINGGDRLKVLELINWGSVKWTRMYRMFDGCANIVYSALDLPDLSEMLIESTLGMRAKWLNAIGLTSISYKGADFSRIIAFGATSSPTGKFNGCTSLTSVDYRDVTWNTTDGIHCGSWFLNTPVTEILGIENCNIKPTILTNAFKNIKMPTLNLSSMNTSILTDVALMLDGVGTLVEVVNCTGWNWAGVTNMAGFARNSSLQVITGLTSGEDMRACTTFQVTYQGSDFNQLFDVQLRLAGVNLSQIFQNSGMSTANYTDTIVYWANYAFDNAGTPINVNMASQSGRTFDTARSGGANFANAGVARTYLTSTCSWTISGDTVI